MVVLTVNEYWLVGGRPGIGGMNPLYRVGATGILAAFVGSWGWIDRAVTSVARARK